MLKVHFFLNEPNGKPWKHFKQMMPRLGANYPIDIDVTVKPKAEYQTDEYFELDLPVAPAVMVGDTIVVEGKDVSEEEVEAEICRQLGLPEPDVSKKGMLRRLFKKSWSKLQGQEMIKLRVFLNEPTGKTWAGFMEMLPRLGSKYKLEIEKLTNSGAHYRSMQYIASGRPAAPALMLTDKLIVQGGQCQQIHGDENVCIAADILKDFPCIFHSL